MRRRNHYFRFSKLDTPLRLSKAIRRLIFYFISRGSGVYYGRTPMRGAVLFLHRLYRVLNKLPEISGRSRDASFRTRILGTTPMRAV